MRHVLLLGGGALGGGRGRRRRVVARPLGALALDGGGEGRLLVPVELAGGVLCGGRGHDDERRRLGDLHRLRRMHGRQQA